MCLPACLPALFNSFHIRILFLNIITFVWDNFLLLRKGNSNYIRNTLDGLKSRCCIFGSLQEASTKSSKLKANGYAKNTTITGKNTRLHAIHLTHDQVQQMCIFHVYEQLIHMRPFNSKQKQIMCSSNRNKKIALSYLNCHSLSNH